MANNNEYMREYMRARYYRRRTAFIESRGGKCVECGSVENLEVDHIDRETKGFDVGKAFAGWSESRLQAELSKCQVLCKKCHGKKTISENAVEHGGGVSGKRNCQCAPCKAKKAEYMKEYKKARPHIVTAF